MSSNLILFILVSMITNINAQAVACTTQTPGTACILDCGGIDTCKQKTLICRAYDPCIIRCDAKATCSAGTTINAYAATDVTVICSGDNACKDEIVINCGTGHCELQCSPQFSTACENFGHIDTSYAASFMCVGRCPHNIPAPFSPNPTLTPTITPSQNPTQPSISPTNHPSSPPSSDPTVDPTIEPTFYPTYNPTIEPTITLEKVNNLTVNVIITVTTIFGLCCVSICLLRLLYLNNKAKKDIEDKNDVNTEEISSNILSIKKQEKKEIDSIVSEIGNKESDDWKIQIITALAEVQFKISNATAKSHSGVGVDYNSSVTMQSRSQHSQHSLHSLQSNGSQCDNSNGVNKVMMNGPPPPPPVVGVSVGKLVEEISSSSDHDDAPSAIASEMKGLIVDENENENDNDEIDNMLIKNEVESNEKV